MAVDQLSKYHDVSDKLYFRLGEVAELAGVPSYVLRFWESEFSIISPTRTDSGQRLYRKSDVEIILTIKHLLHEKRFTIEAAKQHLRQKYAINDADSIDDSDTERIPETGTQFIMEIESHIPQHTAETPPDSAATIKEIYLELQRIRELLS